MSRRNFILAVSIICNIFLLSLLGSNRLKYAVNLDKRSPSTNPYYLHRISSYSILPKSNQDIVFLGDSLTDNCEWAELLNNKEVAQGNPPPTDFRPHIKNRGISGDTTVGVLNRLDDILKVQPKQIFLMIGINDFLKDSSAEQIFDNYQKIVGKIQQISPNTEIIIQSVLPVNKTKYKIRIDNSEVLKLNSYLHSLAKERALKYLDLFSLLVDSHGQLDPAYTLDGVHLNGQAYLVWQQAIKQSALFDARDLRDSFQSHRITGSPVPFLESVTTSPTPLLPLGLILLAYIKDSSNNLTSHSPELAS